jgi:hypothetical protein
VVFLFFMKTYEQVGNISDADCLIGHSFGTSIDIDSPNAQLAYRMLDLQAERPMIADRTLVNAMVDGDNRVAHIVEGPVTNIRAEGVGTWGVLSEAVQFMQSEGLSAPIMVAQAYHINRVVRQAAKLGISSIVPGELPMHFDKKSEQPWTRTALLWIPMNALGSILLKRRGQL